MGYSNLILKHYTHLYLILNMMFKFKFKEKNIQTQIMFLPLKFKTEIISNFKTNNLRFYSM